MEAGDVGWKCPKCGSDDLDVRVSTWARLAQTMDQPENMFSTLADEGLSGDHEWDETSDMLCRECSHSGKAGKFAFEQAPEGCLAVPAGRKG